MIFLGFLVPIGYCASRISYGILNRMNLQYYTPVGGLVVMGIFAAMLLLVTWIMAKIEGRTIADYGLPWRRAFCGQFWLGASISFLSLTALLFMLHLLGAYSFGSRALHGAEVLKYGTVWAVPLFLAAMLEDFFYRGYVLFTLTTGIGFWPAAILTSLLMGGAHHFNPGGRGLGPVSATAYCLVTCLILRRSTASSIRIRWQFRALYEIAEMPTEKHSHLMTVNYTEARKRSKMAALGACRVSST
jgi:hypothetical protein